MSEPSRIEVAAAAAEVTLFEDRAAVTRRGKVRLPAGVSWVSIPGIGIAVDDESVQPRFPPGGPRLLSTRVVRQVRQSTAARAAEIEQPEAELAQVVRGRVIQEQSVARAQARKVRAHELARSWIEQLTRVPRVGLASDPAIREQCSERVHAALEELRQHQLLLLQARRDEQRIRLRVEQARAVTPRFEAAIEIQVEAEREAEVLVEVSYRIPCAAWRPEVLARMVPASEGRGAQLEVTQLATAWQHTGEEWRDVALHFSTARPARAANAPFLADDVLVSRHKSAEDRKTVTVEVRDERIQVAGVSRGSRALDEMPGVDDGGEPLACTAARPTTLVSDGQPLRVELGVRSLPCVADAVSYPERSGAVFMRATATLSGDTPLLAGPVWSIRQREMMGRSSTRFVGLGEPFELAMGFDDGLRIRREQEEQWDTVPITGTRKGTRTVRVHLSNLSDQPKRLTVIERLPVSEIADVGVKLIDGEPTRHDAEQGMLYFERSLAPSETKTLTFKYRLELSSKVRIDL